MAIPNTKVVVGVHKREFKVDRDKKGEAARLPDMIGRKTLMISGGGMLVAAAILALTGLPGDDHHDSTPTTSRLPQVDSERRSRDQSRESARNRVIASLPDRTPIVGSHRLTEDVASRLEVFRKLGAIDGEEALDYLMFRYGQHSGGASFGLPHAMAFAFMGWMEQDFEAALKAFDDFVIDGSPIPGRNMFRWRDQEFFTGTI